MRTTLSDVILPKNFGDDFENASKTVFALQCANQFLTTNPCGPLHVLGSMCRFWNYVYTKQHIKCLQILKSLWIRHVH